MTEAEVRRIFAKAPRTLGVGRRGTLTTGQRRKIWEKTAGTCHVCGGPSGPRWQADHVIPHERGGTHAWENYLPICCECNRLRWSYSPEVLRMILQFGVLAKQEIRHDTKLGRLLLKRAMQIERRRSTRRSAKSGSSHAA